MILREGYDDGQVRSITPECDECEHRRNHGTIICTYGPEWRQLSYGAKQEPCEIIANKATKPCTVFVDTIAQMKTDVLPNKRVIMYARQAYEFGIQGPEKEKAPVELRAFAKQEDFPHDFPVTSKSQLQQYMDVGFTLDWAEDIVTLGKDTPGYRLCPMPVELIQNAELGDLFGV